jgi:alpha-ketoglutarate-dependent taurine dioxygenase
LTTTDTSSLTIEAVAGALGANVTGLDLTKVTTSDELEGLRRALAEHLVVFLP